MVKCLSEFKYFTVLLKNRKFISKIRRSKVTDYAALSEKSFCNKMAVFLISQIIARQDVHYHDPFVRYIVMANLGTYDTFTSYKLRYFVSILQGCTYKTHGNVH